MRIAVTGGGGRLGCSVVRQLLKRGDQVKVLEPGKGVPPSLKGLDVEIQRGSVLLKDEVTAFVKGADVVMHLAAKVSLDKDHDGSIRAVNVDGPRVVADACLAARIKMIHCSSHHAYELKPLSAPHDESKPLCVTDPCDYHRTKALGQQLIQGYVREKCLDAVIVNPGSMIGPEDYEPSMIGKALVDLYHRRVPMLMEVIADYVDARDVAAGAINAIDRGRRGEAYLLTGIVHDMRDLVGMWQELTGVPMPKVILPLWVGWAMLPAAMATARVTGKAPLFTAGVLRAAICSRDMRHDKARRELGFSPRPVKESLRDMYEFFKAQGWLEQPSLAAA